MKIKVVELFAGVGGFRVGLEKSSDDFETIWANQWEPNRKVQHAYNCYTQNFENNVCVNENISLVKQNIPKHDLLVGGFPCQDYSVASTGAKGIEGKKGVLWWDIRDIVESKKPKYILLENVDRLLKSPAKQRGRDFGVILKSLSDLGYSVEWRVVNAAEYGFVQRRRRVFIFAARKTTKYYKNLKRNEEKTDLVSTGFFSDIFPCKEEIKKRNTEFNFKSLKELSEVSKNFECLFWNAGIYIGDIGYTMQVIPEKAKFKKLKSILESNVSEKYFLTSKEASKFDVLRGSKKIARTRADGSTYFYSEGSMSKHDELDLPARTMLTSESTVNRSTHIIQDPLKNKLRKLTPIECERLNGFKDDWTGKNVMPESIRYFCMGNALVVGLVTIMGKKIREIEIESNSGQV